jgi:hypothetical protein
MKKTLLEMLALMPFLLKTDLGNGGYGFKANIPEIVRTLIITVFVSACGAYITITKLEVNQAHIIESNKIMVERVDKACERIGYIAEGMAVIKTRQDDRLERERANGIRR